MAVDPLIAFSMTILPLLALIFGILVSLWGTVRVDRWLLLGTVLLGLMGGHQLTEAYQLVLGGNPYPSLFGEGFETAVNLLAAGLLWVVTRRILTERRHREQQAVLARELSSDSRPVGGEAEVDDSGADGLFGLATSDLPLVGRFVTAAFRTLPLGTTADLPSAIETAVRNLQVTYPATTVDRETVEELTVFAEPSTLAEIVETVLKQFVVYNDTNDPAISIAVSTRGSTAVVRIEDNGPGLPNAVADQLAGQDEDSMAPNFELVPVHGLLEKWGGSITVESGAVEISVLRTKSGGSEIE